MGKEPLKRALEPTEELGTDRPPDKHRYFDPKDIPPSLRKIPDEAMVKKGNLPGKSAVFWGWREWIALAPRLHKHTRAHGRVNLTKAILEAQLALLPEQFHRSHASVSVATAPSAKPDILTIVAFICAMLEAQHTPPSSKTPKPPKPKPPRKAPPLKAISAVPIAEFPAAENARQIPNTWVSSDPQAASSYFDQVLAMPIATLLPVLKTLFTQALKEALMPHHTELADLVRAAVIDVVGAPAANPVPPQEAPLTQGSMPTGTAIHIPPPPDRPAEAPERPSETETVQEATPPAPDLYQAPHDLKTQMALAAKALGIEPAPKPVPKRPPATLPRRDVMAERKHVLIVGFHPKIEEEISRSYGDAFRFMFKRCDEFNCAKDLPASTDAVIFTRKKLTHELVTTMRRYSIPAKSVSNTTAAAFHGLRDTLPDASLGLREPLRETA